MSLIALIAREKSIGLYPQGKGTLLGLSDALQFAIDDTNPTNVYRIDGTGTIELLLTVEKPINYDEDNYPKIPVEWIVNLCNSPDDYNKPITTIRAGDLWDLYRKLGEYRPPNGLFEFATFAGIKDKAAFMWEGKYWTIELEIENE